MALWKIWLLNTDLFCESLFIKLSATHYLLQSINVVQPSNKNNVVCSFICWNQHVLPMQFLSIPVPVYPCPLRNINIVFPPLFLSLLFFFLSLCPTEASLLRQKTLKCGQTISVSVSWPRSYFQWLPGSFLRTSALVTGSLYEMFSVNLAIL